MNTIKYILLSSLVLFSFSCKEKTEYEMDLVLENSTENSITVELFPNSKYKHDDMYRTSDIGEGYNFTKFTIFANSKEVFFTSKDINQQPCDLLSNVFDSIHISINNESQYVIKFSKDAVIGYSDNIFTENSIWDYEIINDDRPTQFAKNPVEVHLFTFEVSINKLIK